MIISKTNKKNPRPVLYKYPIKSDVIKAERRIKPKIKEPKQNDG